MPAAAGGPAGVLRAWRMKGAKRHGRLSGPAAVWLLLAAASGAWPGEQATRLDAWLAAGVTDIDYEEFDHGASQDREEGTVPGLGAGLHLARGRLFAEGMLDAGSGHVDYRAAGIATTTDEDILDGDVIGGRELLRRQDSRLGLYAGLGYRHWRRDIRSTPAAFGLDETYRWWYGILGVRGEYDVNDRVRLRADMALTRTLDPSIKVRFAAGYDDATLDLGAANGLRVAVALENRLGNGMALFVSPWYEYWKLGRSADAVLRQNGIPAGTVFEPQSETHNLGIHAGVRWRLF